METRTLVDNLLADSDSLEGIVTENPIVTAQELNPVSRACYLGALATPVLGLVPLAADGIFGNANYASTGPYVLTGFCFSAVLFPIGKFFDD